MTPMTVDFLSAIAVGIGIAALLYAAAHALRKAGMPLPRWVLPAAIGLGVFAFAVWNEYDWFDRTRAGLPEGVQIVARGTESNMWRPWSYLVPVTTRFAAIDPAVVEIQPDGVRRAQLMLFRRWGQTLLVGQDFDCTGGRIRPPESDWIQARPDDPAFIAVCQGG